jgi:hypothetical protein
MTTQLTRCPQTASDGREKARGGHGAKAAAVREQAITALLVEPNIQKAASRVGVSYRSLRRWIAEDSEFRADLEAARRANFQNAMDRIQAGSERAVLTLEALLTARQPPSVRLGAARTILELGLHRHDAESIVKRLSEVEAMLRERDSA